MTNREFFEQLLEQRTHGLTALTPLQREWFDYYIGARQVMSWQQMRAFDNAELEPPAEYC